MSNRTPFFLGIVIGASVLPVLGFAFLGWKLDSKAQAMAQDAAYTAVEKVLMPICVAQFNADPNVAEHTAALKAEQFEHTRVEYIEKGGWAMLPGHSEPVSGLARSCENAIHDTF